MQVAGHPERPDRVRAILDAVKHSDLELSPDSVLPAEESPDPFGPRGSATSEKLDLAAERVEDTWIRTPT